MKAATSLCQLYHLVVDVEWMRQGLVLYDTFSALVLIAGW